MPSLTLPPARHQKHVLPMFSNFLMFTCKLKRVCASGVKLIVCWFVRDENRNVKNLVR